MFGWMWLWQATVIESAPPTDDPETSAFRAGKRQACRYAFTYELARVPYLASLLESLDDTTLAMRSEWF